MRTRHIVAFVVLVGGSLASSAALAWDQNPFAMYFQRSDKITLWEGDAKAVNAATHVIDPWPAMLATGEFRGTAIDCRARSSATARDRTGSRRRRSRRMWATVRAAAVSAAAVSAAARLAAGLVAVVRAAGLVAVVRAAVQRAAVGRHNEAKPICGRDFDPKLVMNAATIGP